LCGRLLHGQPEKGLVVTGLRGSGKTVLLRALRDQAGSLGCATAGVDAKTGRPLADLLARALAQALPPGDPPVAAPPDPGAALAAAGASWAARNGALVVCLDNVHALAAAERTALWEAQRRLHQDRLPVSLFLAGLPFLDEHPAAHQALASETCDTLELGPLPEADAARCLRETAQGVGARFTPEALTELVRVAKGVPYLLQVWAAAAQRLDTDFYGPGYELLGPRERDYLRTMAHLGPGPHRTGDIADSMDSKITALGPLRAKLMRRGLLYSPAHGLLGFTTPGYETFMLRAMPNFR
jgi:hypothetical protein